MSEKLDAALRHALELYTRDCDRWMDPQPVVDAIREIVAEVISEKAESDKKK